MIKLNGYQANAVVRKDKKALLCYALAGAMATFRINIKMLAAIADVNYGSLKNGLCNPASISVEKLSLIHDKLMEHIKNNHSGDSKFKLHMMTSGEIINEKH